MEDLLQLYSPYLSWQKKKSEKEGVIVATDITLEWLLPWWWEKYRAHNDFPVTFVDFGMSTEAKEWCQDRGTLVFLGVADIFVKQKGEIPKETTSDWEKNFSTRFWPYRNAWFKKPLAFLQSTYKRGLWIDLDCEVRASVADLFALADHSSKIALFQESSSHSNLLYNSGVVSFAHGCPLIKDWAKESFLRNGEFRGDQDLLSWMIKERRMKINQIPAEYNWLRTFPDNPKAKIIHWHGDFGKAEIRHQIQNQIMQTTFLSN